MTPASASPLASPVTATIRGAFLGGGVLSSDAPLLLDVAEVRPDRIQLRISFRGARAGEHWIRVRTSAGRDSVPFTVEPLGPSEALPEARALWVSRFEYASPEDLSTILERAAEAGFNVIYLQVRGRADAFYRSAYEPWSQRLTGTLGEDPGWDPLAWAVAAARERDIEIHAWINAFTGWAGTQPPPESRPRHAFLEHPDWAMVDEDGVAMPYHEGTRWLTPGHPGVRTRLAAVAADIARGYDVAGIHLDFIRYPDARYSFDGASLAAYDSARALEPSVDFAEMRRRFVTWAVAETRDSLEGAAENVALSAAVWGVYRNVLGWSSVSTGYDDVLQDARAWARQRLVDALVPMVYWTIDEEYGDRLDFAYLADEHASRIDVPAYIGLHVPTVGSDGLWTHIERARLAGAEGVALFSFSSLDRIDAWKDLRDGPFYWPAIVLGTRRACVYVSCAPRMPIRGPVTRKEAR